RRRHRASRHRNQSRDRKTPRTGPKHRVGNGDVAHCPHLAVVSAFHRASFVLKWNCPLRPRSKSMPRHGRVVVSGLPHHITHRGNRRSDIFKNMEDRQIDLRLLRKHAEQEGLKIWAYALMSNHVHLVAVPECEESLAATLRSAHGTYATHFNGHYETVGHLWQGRFYSCVLDDTHTWNAVRESNPEVIDCRIRRRTFTGYPCGSDEFLRELEKRLGRTIRRRVPGRPKRGA